MVLLLKYSDICASQASLFTGIGNVQNAGYACAASHPRISNAVQRRIYR
jgi:hypothetical protein